MSRGSRGWHLVEGPEGFVVRDGWPPEGATVLLIATWPCARCQAEPVLAPGRVCQACQRAGRRGASEGER